MADIDMVYDLVKETRNDVSDIKKDMKTGAVTMGRHDLRLGHIEDDVKSLKTGQKKIKETVFNHANDKKVHYNQGFKETFPQRVWRKRGEIGLTTSLLGIITIIVNHYFGG